MTVPLIDDDPRQLGDLVIESRIGEGASAVVLRGREPDGTAVAVKLLHRHLATAPGVRDLLRREAIALARVRGTRVARILEVHADEERPYIVTEFIPGESLAQIVERAPLPGTLLTSALDGVAEALTEIHAAGIVHRDLKPSNIIYGPEGIRVVDFGISVLDEFAGSTRTGTLVGTPAWLSPEQAVGRPVDAASDVFNFGMLIVFASTGRNPFGQGRPDAMLYRVVNESPDLTGVPDRLLSLAASCLDKDPAARPPLEQVRATLAGTGSGSGNAEGAGDRAPGDADATALGSTTMLGQYAARDAVSTVAPTARAPKRRGLVIGLAAALVAVLAVTGVAVANLVAPFGGSIEVAIENQSTANEFLSDPVFRVEVDNGEDGEVAVSGSDTSHTVGTWHPDSTITLSYEPQYADDEPYEQTWTAGELGVNYLNVGHPLRIALTITDDAVLIRVPGGGAESEAVLERGNEKAYISAQTAAYGNCVGAVKAGWSNELSEYIEATTAYNEGREANWTADQAETWQELGARAEGVANVLFLDRASMIANTPAVVTAIAPYSGEVESARDAVWDAMMNLGTYWDGFSASLYSTYDYNFAASKTVQDIFPREWSLIGLGETALWNSVDELQTAIWSDAAPACRAKYPDAR